MKGFFNGVAAVLLLAGITVAAAFVARWGIHWLFDGVDPTVSAAIVAAAATTMVSVLGIALGRYFERRRQIEVELRERKIPMYTTFVEGLLQIFNREHEDGGDAVDPSEISADADFDMVAFLREMTPQLMIWASNDVVSRWSTFRRGADQHEAVDNVFLMEELLTAIRKDLGHSGDLPKGQLLGLYVNDIDDYVGPGRSGRRAS